MTKTQIQLPDEMYQQLKALAIRSETSLAELLRRGAEYVLRVHAHSKDAPAEWALPEPLDLGEPLAPAKDWRALANEPDAPGQGSHDH